MIIFLYGSDTYRRGKKLQEIVSQAWAKYPEMTFGRFDCNEGEEDVFRSLQEFVLQASMFSPKKMAITEGLLGHDDKKVVGIFLKSLLDAKDVALVLLEDAPPRKTGPFSFLFKAPVTVQEFGALSPAQITAFARNEAEERGVNISKDILFALTQRFGADTWGFVTELSKLALAKGFSHTDFARIVSDHDAPQNFFALLMALERGGHSQKLFALEQLFLSGEEPAKLFNMLASRAKSVDTLQRFADYDIAVKSGKLEYEEVLLELVIG